MVGEFYPTIYTYKGVLMSPCQFFSNKQVTFMPESDPVKKLQKKEDVDVVVQQRKKKLYVLPKSREWKTICWVDEYGFPHSESQTIEIVNANVDPNNLSRKLTKFDEWFRDNYHAIFNYNL